MANVVRFTLSTARTLYVSGAGTFIDGVLDIDANNGALLTKTRYLVQPYRAIEIGIVDESTPKPVLPAVPLPPAPDPYPQYLTPSELASTPELRSAAVAAVEAATSVTPTGAWNFAQTPTVAGVAIGTGGGSGGSDPTKVDTSAVGVPNGVASLGSDGKLPASQVPDLAIAQYLGTTASQAEMLALAGQRGDWTTRSDTGTVFVLNADTPATLSSWTQLSYPAPQLTGVEGVKTHDGTTGGGTRPTGYARVRWVGGTTRPTNMAAGDIWEHDA